MNQSQLLRKIGIDETKTFATRTDEPDAQETMVLLLQVWHLKIVTHSIYDLLDLWEPESNLTRGHVIWLKIFDLDLKNTGITQTGKIARFLAKYRPFQPILACSTSSFTVRQCNLSRGIIGYKIPVAKDALINLVLKVAMEQGLCLPGSKVLIFYTENEGKKNENVNFKLLEIEDVGWSLEKEEKSENSAIFWNYPKIIAPMITFYDKELLALLKYIYIKFHYFKVLLIYLRPLNSITYYFLFLRQIPIKILINNVSQGNHLLRSSQISSFTCISKYLFEGCLIQVSRSMRALLVLFKRLS